MMMVIIAISTTSGRITNERCMQTGGGYSSKFSPMLRPLCIKTTPAFRTSLRARVRFCSAILWCEQKLVIVVVRRRFRFRAEADAPDVHALPDPRTGEGIPLQPLPDAPTSDRDRARAGAHRTPDQNLVSEPPHEVEEGEQRGEVDRAFGERRRTGGGALQGPGPRRVECRQRQRRQLSRRPEFPGFTDHCSSVDLVVHTAAD